MKPIVSKKIVSSLIINGILIATVIVMIIPMIIMLAYSLFQYPESFISPWQFFQETPSFQNYADIFITDTFGRYFVNSLMIAIIVTIGNVFFASLCGYAFARYDFPWKHILFASVMGLMMVPQQVIMIPLYRMMVAFDWIDTFWALIIPGILAPFAVFLMRQFIQSLPSDIEDAARIDGAGELYIFFRIVLPLCKPVITVLAIYTFLGSWNSFLYPFLFTNSPEMRTLPVGLAYYIGRQSIDWGHLMAGASISAVPVLLLFILFSKKIIEGLTAGALKE
ncbi:MAG: carbohydrate ABC transporter permease [Bacteroidota bacterium]